MKDRKKKKHEDEDDEEDENDFDDDEDFDFDDDFYEMMNAQFKNAMKAFPGMFPNNIDFSSKEFKRLFVNIFKQLNIKPEDLKNMDPNEIQKMMNQTGGNMGSPFVFGMNMRFGPDGKPIVDSFGNMKKKSEGETEVTAERDPLVDIYEEDGQIVCVMEVPGVEKDQIELRAAPNELEVIAESSETHPHHRSYHKIIPLPAEINPDIAKARYQNGILEVKLTKIGQKKNQRKIQID